MDRNDGKCWADVRPGYWFAPKLFGWGATPVTWQGWAVTIGYIAVVVGIANWLADPWRWLAVVLPSIAFLIVVHRRTDGGWRWRWGRTD